MQLNSSCSGLRLTLDSLLKEKVSLTFDATFSVSSLSWRSRRLNSPELWCCWRRTCSGVQRHGQSGRKVLHGLHPPTGRDSRAGKTTDGDARPVLAGMRVRSLHAGQPLTHPYVRLRLCVKQEETIRSSRKSEPMWVTCRWIMEPKTLKLLTQPKQ